MQRRGGKDILRNEEWTECMHSGERECERKRKKMSKRERKSESLCVRNLIVQLSMSSFFFYSVSCSENTFPLGILSLKVPIF